MYKTTPLMGTPPLIGTNLAVPYMDVRNRGIPLHLQWLTPIASVLVATKRKIDHDKQSEVVSREVGLQSTGSSPAVNRVSIIFLSRMSIPA